eukprot:CAMPEP_0169449334 /NCGR_PEP_ID=MMETSP1042-20121227/12552_1 /TAXON_ID=464988 /ORGANISM="Hemiselmis andersenii, Strain CCMP1180" /LENGTH=80 /DNA_ID=CAMNT_0009561059 /DNA_START=113 /DNA_END=351 /DNA_ORIENTATION=+
MSPHNCAPARNAKLAPQLHNKNVNPLSARQRQKLSQKGTSRALGGFRQHVSDPADPGELLSLLLRVLQVMLTFCIRRPQS